MVLATRHDDLCQQQRMRRPSTGEQRMTLADCEVIAIARAGKQHPAFVREAAAIMQVGDRPVDARIHAFEVAQRGGLRVRDATTSGAVLRSIHAEQRMRHRWKPRLADHKPRGLLDAVRSDIARRRDRRSKRQTENRKLQSTKRLQNPHGRPHSSYRLCAVMPERREFAGRAFVIVCV